MSTNRRIRILLAPFGGTDVGSLQRLVAAEPRLELAGVLDYARTSAGDHAADALLVVTPAPDASVLQLVSDEVTARRGMPVVVVCGGSPNGFVGDVLAAGADDLIVTDQVATSGPDIFFALQKALSRRSAHAPAQSTSEGELIVVLGPKGGTGKTLTTSNLGTALASEGKRVAMLDLDLQFGDLGLVLGLMPQRTIFDLATTGGTLDADKVEAFMTPHASGAKVLLAPMRPDHASAIRTEFLRDLYTVLRSTYDYVVVDTPPGFTPEVIVSVDASSSVCLIGTLDAPSLKNAKLGAETLDLMGYPTDRVRIILNRADANIGVSHADVVKVLGRKPDVFVPSHRDIVRSVNMGEPIVLASPRSEAAKAYTTLARSYIAASGPAKPAGRSEPAPSRGRGFRARVGR